VKGSAQTNTDRTYTFRNAALTRFGQFPVTFTITAGSDSDLLAGELVIADPVAAKPGASNDPRRTRWWWVAGALVLLAGFAIAWWSRRKRVKGIAQ
jgi:hypothetical protein